MPTMWDRLRTPSPGAQKARQRQAAEDDVDDGKPSFDHETTFAQSGLGHMGYTYSIKGGTRPPPPRPQREFLSVPYETAPAVQELPPRNPKRTLSKIGRVNSFQRPPSSVYSQPSPQDAAFSSNVASPQSRRYGGTDGDISPPSSPEPDYSYEYRPKPRQGSLPDVSPIDDDLSDMSHALGASRDGRGAMANRDSPNRNHDRPQTRTSITSNGNSNIPMMRRARRQQADQAVRKMHSQERLGSSAGKADVRWDPMTGERTNSMLGRPSQVNPAEYAHGLGISNSNSNMATSPPPTSPMTAATFGERVRLMAKAVRSEQKPAGNRAPATASDTDPAAAAFMASQARPAWRGASGRSTLVEPVRDTAQVAPLKIPEKNNRRVFSPTSASATTASAGPSQAVPNRGQTPPVSPPPGAHRSETKTGPGPQETNKRGVPSSQLSQSPAATADPYGGLSYPSPPNSGNLAGFDAPSVTATQQFPNAINSLPSQSPTSPTSHRHLLQDKPIKRKPPPSHANFHHQHQASVSSAYSQPDEQDPSATGKAPASSSQNAKGPYLAANEPWAQPPSRFSISTHATSNTGTTRESFDDRGSDWPSLHTKSEPFRDSPHVKQETPSVMDRRRPVRRTNGEGTSPIVVSFKESAYMSSPYAESPSQAARERKGAAIGLPSNPAVNVSRARTTAERPVSSASSINKSLPQPPPEASADFAGDRVGLLNAQLSSLGNRRINLTRSIKQMTELMPTDNLMASEAVLLKREMEKRKVAALRDELAEVQREEYELGLKLHRAYKRLDKNADYEPTTLWVRRVTG